MLLRITERKEWRQQTQVSTRRNLLFTTRVVQHWNKLPRQAVEFPSFTIFGPQLGKALSNLASTLKLGLF